MYVAIYAFIFSLYVQVVRGGQMPADGTLCTLIESTNLNSLYGWSCSDDDCQGSAWVLLDPVSGDCSGNDLIVLEITNVNGAAALEGSIPSAFGTLARPLQHLDLHINKLTGTIPSNIGTIHSTLTYLDLSDNKLGGTVPASLCDAGVLNTIDVSGNSAMECYESCLSTVPNNNFGDLLACGSEYSF
jgi:hypothetical protein